MLRKLFCTVLVYLLSSGFAFGAEKLLAVLSEKSPSVTVEMNPSAASADLYLVKVDGKTAFQGASLDSAFVTGAKLLAAYQIARSNAVQVRSEISQVDFGKQKISVYNNKDEVVSVLTRPGQDKALESAFRKAVAQGRATGAYSPLARCEFKLSKLSWMAKEGVPVSSSVSVFARKILQITSEAESINDTHAAEKAK